VVATITVGVGPIGVAYDQGKNEVFVSNELSSTVSIISDSNNQVIKTVNAGSGPEGLAYDSAKGEIYVADEVGGGFEAISDSSNTVVATNTFGSQTYSGNPTDLAYDSAKAEIFEETGTYIVAVSANSNAVVAYAPLVQLPISSDSYGPLALGVAYDSSKGEVFVVDSGSNEVSVLSDSFSGSSSSTPTSTPNSSSTATSTPSSTTAPSSSSNNLLFIIVGVVIAVVVVGGIVGFKFIGRKGKTVGSVSSASGSSDLGKPASKGAPKTDDSTSSLNNENASKPLVQEPNPPVQQAQTQTTQPSQQPQQPQQKPLTQQERTERFRRLVNTFQQKGATSPEKAMTAEELGLPPRFEDFMEKRAPGQTKVFQEINGKYYLDQKALKEMRQQWANRKQ
jgi:YVTN family beta-propeller protein